MREFGERGRAGFAIVVTLVLMAFAVGLIVVLAALVRIEGAISDHALHRALARQNARLALTVALAQLQKHAGPDTRVTATAAAFGGNGGSVHYTGVWDATHGDVAPLAWLVSGSENGVAPFPANGDPVIELVGKATSGIAGDVSVPVQTLSATASAGVVGTATSGHYAWWVGDEGVKASVGLPDRSAGIIYPPYDSVELRSRLHQQRALWPGPADANGVAVFEPRDPSNQAILSHVLELNQLAHVHDASGAAIGQAVVRENFQRWTTNHEALLTNSKEGGLRSDLSVDPDVLGSAFAAWTRYPDYMETADALQTPAISPAYPAGGMAESLRRRFRMVAPQSSSGTAHGIAPVISYLLLTFNVRTDQSVGGNPRPLEVRARWLVSLWNPYTSALVPEDLQLEISGLPTVTVVNDTTGVSLPSLALDSLYGAPLCIALPWVPGGRADQQSWLPGRVYSWSANEDLNKAAAVPVGGFATVFYTRTMSTTAGQGVQRAVPWLALANSAQAHVQGTQTQLTLRLYRSLVGGGRELLGGAASPTFNAFSTTPAAINGGTYQFSYLVRLAESIDTPVTPEAWLTAAGQDVRESQLSPLCYLPGPNGPRPELYPNYTSASFPDRLLDRALPASAGSTTGQSYNEDTTLFELPRGPILSIGALQNLHTNGTRPWAIGNSWGQATGSNALFDRCFFSGLTPEVIASIPAHAPLPNPGLRIFGRNSEGGNRTNADLAGESATGLSSKYLRQSGAFNVNSTDPLAWLAVLRSGRYGAGEGFVYLDAMVSSGTSGDTSKTATGFGDAVFFRYPWSAQETFKASAGYAASTSEPPAPPTTASIANTHLFRRGVRALTADQSVALAQAIAESVAARLAVSGPFRSMEAFLAPDALFGGRNVLEAAIATTRGADGILLNDPSTVAEFSPQWLTSGDVMSTLAPVLFSRSDTFIIRAYGDVVNPVTGDRQARAWLEARVQRTVEYVDASQAPETAPTSLNSCNQTYGRRFRIVSFRWLDHSDI